MRSLTIRFVRCLTLTAFGTAGLSAQGPYTAAQASAGRSAYLGNCASCHLPDLAGRNGAPQLSGNNFMRAWRDRTPGALAQYIQATMPPGNPGRINEAAGLNLAAFILEANGAHAGTQPLTSTASVTIGSVATGQMPEALRV